MRKRARNLAIAAAVAAVPAVMMMPRAEAAPTQDLCINLYVNVLDIVVVPPTSICL